MAKFNVKWPFKVIQVNAVKTDETGSIDTTDSLR